jgi:hypothetical protein
MINRVGSPGFPKTLPAVILQKGAFDGVKQPKFSFDPTTAPANSPEVKTWNGIQQMARERLQDAVNGNIPYGPRYFRTAGSSDSFFDPRIEDGRLVPMGTVGGNEFYEEPTRIKSWP